MSSEYKLLAVDDNQLNLGLFRLFLTQLGHQVTAVSDPFEALQELEQNRFDLILTDIQMPGMSGIELGTKLRQTGFNGPIIAITAHLSNLEEAEIESSQLDAILIKPVTKTDLARLIEDWVTQPRPKSDVKLIDPPKLRVSPSQTYDLDLALARANDSEGLVVEMLALLSESLRSSLLILRQNPDEQTLNQCLHQMIGGVRFSGAAQLEAELENLHYLIEHKTIEDEDIERLISKIQAVVDWHAEQPNPFKR